MEAAASSYYKKYKMATTTECTSHGNDEDENLGYIKYTSIKV